MLVDKNEDSYKITWPTKPGSGSDRNKEKLNFQTPALMLKNVLIDYPYIDDELILLGIEGEERVFNLIEKALGNSIAFHSIPLKGINKDIDHLIVIGNEVYLLNTKNYRLKSILVDGEYVIYGRKRLTDLIDLQRDAREVEKLTGIKVKPLLVLSTNIRVTVKNTPIVPIVNLESLKKILEAGANLTPSSNYLDLINNRKTWGGSSIKQFTPRRKSRKILFSKRKSMSKKSKNKLIRKMVFGLLALLFMIPSINSMLSLSKSLNSNSNLTDFYSQIPKGGKPKLDTCYSEAGNISTLNLCNSFHGESKESDLPEKKANCERLGGYLNETGIEHKWECNQTPENCIKNSQNLLALNLCNVTAKLPKNDPVRIDKIVQEKVFKCETFGGALVYNECKIL